MNILQEAEFDSGFLGYLATTGSNPWMVNLTLGKRHVRFKIDTGADVTAIPEHTFAKIFKPSQLQPTDRILYGPGQTKLETVGKIQKVLHLNASHNGRQHTAHSYQNIYVVKHLSQGLLGRPAIEALHILSRADLSNITERQDGLAEVQKTIPKVVHRIGQT